MNAPVMDPFDVASDSAMPTLPFALDPIEAQRRFERCLPRLSGPHGRVHVCAIRVVRHKPGRRCVIEYDVEVERPDRALAEQMTLMGKVRVRRFGKSGYRRLESLWNAGFQADCQDGISVPEPIGTVSRFQMWLQRKVPGLTATELLTAPGATELVRRIAEAAHKLHRAAVPTESRHTMADELRILHECLSRVEQAEPHWANRLARVLEACERLGASIPAPAPCGIHRDFYSDQVIVHGPRLYLIDFDLYCEGDPGLDIGNFLGHITEQSLRQLGDSEALAGLEQAMEERFVELSGEASRVAVRAYATLTLVRHIYLSTRFEERRPLTERLLELCEERLDITGASAE